MDRRNTAGHNDRYESPPDPGYYGLGWRDLKIAVEYEGKHHRLSRAAFDKDIRRIDELIEQGWIVIRVTAADTEATILRKLAAAWARRTTA